MSVDEKTMEVMCEYNEAIASVMKTRDEAVAVAWEKYKAESRRLWAKIKKAHKL